MLPPGADSYEVQDLKVGTKYSFSIMAFNAIGSSEFTKDIGKVETKSRTTNISITLASIQLYLTFGTKSSINIFT